MDISNGFCDHTRHRKYCPMTHFRFLGFLSYGECRSREHFFLWYISFYQSVFLMLHDAFCLGHVILQGISSYGACNLMGHVILWGMLSHGACCLMGHVVLWGMLSHGAFRLIGHVALWGMWSYGECRPLGCVVLLGIYACGACCLMGLLSMGL